MSLKSGRIQEYRWGPGSLTAIAVSGTINVYSDAIQGQIKSIHCNTNNHTALGSYLLFESGLFNSGTALGGLIMRWCVGSTNQVFQPYVYKFDHQGNLGSYALGGVSQYNIYGDYIITGPLRLVGSGLGASTSGLGIVVKYQ